MRRPRASISAPARAATIAVSLVAAFLVADTALAYISQADGTVVPQTTRMQQCLDRPVTGETMAGAVSALADAAILPEAFRPVENPIGSGSYPVTFRIIGEGAGYRNTFGFVWTDADPTVTANLQTIFGCRPMSAQCACPCDPELMRPGMAWQRTIDLATVPGFSPGRTLTFWIRTPERVDGSGNDPDNCGDRTDTSNRIYFTSRSLNDDGDYVHYLVYPSATHTNAYYFGLEDLFRGGDNDFEDVLVRADGLVPLCDPRPEVCNGVDDDCDLAIDEGITMPCSTACGAGLRTCAAGSFGACSAPAPTSETCNGVDDDCDGTTDEGLSRGCSNACGSGSEICVAGSWVDCSAPAPSIEVCNGADDDCDGAVDEGITRACFRACGSGTETCVAGAYVGCTAPGPMTETCNGVDDDCDGLTDEGLTRACSSACGMGLETCISGVYVGCTAPAAGLEVCNALDDDCDGMVDEGLTRTCSTSCGVGTETCAAGVWGGCDAPTAAEELCDNVDNDCNGVIDDGNPGGGALCLPNADGTYTLITEPPPPGEDGICRPGEVRCVAGTLRCVGASSSTREICNCRDDDCDGEVDEGALCAGGACVGCACVSPCGGEEFPCPPGRVCDRSLADPDAGVIGYCVPGACAGVSCPPEQVCDPVSGECRDPCDGVSCPTDFACVRGACVEDNCYGRGCGSGERCRMGACEADPCASTRCAEGEFCRDGACIPACPAACVGAEVCRDGACVPSGCDAPCSDREVCIDGACVTSSCVPTCRRGRVCRGAVCVDDPCAGIACPSGTMCRDGACGREPAPAPDAPSFGLAAGGGGCACSAAGQGAPSSPGSGLLGLLALSFLGGLWRRRRAARARVSRGGAAGVRAQSPVDPAAAGRASVRRAAAVLGALSVLCAALLSGCAVDPFCFDCEERDGGPDAGPDARVPDGCAPELETCNGVDDDCDGEIDEDFDLQTDPGNCGACGSECMLDFAFPACVGGACAIERCEVGHHDLNGDPLDGCEYGCESSGDEICDERDNDCDGLTDEDFDLSTDLGNCGACGDVCVFPNASASCVAGACAMGPCNPGFVDADLEPGNGCEYACGALGAELCNGVDDDCDMSIDEGFDLSMDPANCGTCGVACVFPNATGACVAGACAIASCAMGFHDVDGDPATGCEYPCTPSGGADVCNGADDDCDGAVDEADPMVGSACGSSVGACRQGLRACQFGRLVCVGERLPTSEVCNGTDDDCDGMTDETSAAFPLPGTGVRCGSTNEGRCEFGTVVCAMGALVCGGAFVGPAAETCDGVDDDCDGAIDDTPAPPASTPATCVETRGVCAGRTPTCRGVTGWGCSLPATHQAVETICDGLDNDCDGSTDEGCLVPAPATDRRVDLGDAGGAENSVQPVVSGDGGARVYAAWMDLRNAGGAHVFFNRSTDTGNTWGGAPTQLDVANGAAIGPRFGTTGATRDDIALVWADFRGGTSYREIYRRFSTDFGAGWGASDGRINPGQNVDSFNVRVAVAGTNVWVVYESFSTPRTRHIFAARSSDGGSTWGAPVQVDHGVGATFVAATPDVAAVGANAFVVWRDNRSGALDVFVNRLTASGATGISVTATDTRLDVGTVPGASQSFAPAVATEGGNVYVVWVDDRAGGSFDIWMNRSTDGGATFRTTDAIALDADPLPHFSIEPRVVAPQPGVAVVAWVDYRFGFPDVLARRSADSGASFSAPVRLDTGSSPGASASLDLALGANGSLVAAAWVDDRSGLYDVYSNFSLDGGATFQPADQRLDSTAVPGSSDSLRPDIYVAPAAAHVVWTDHRSGANGDVYYRRLQ